MTVLVKKVFISSKPSIVCLLCPPPCGPFSIQESAVGGLSYKVKKAAIPTFHGITASFNSTSYFIAFFQRSVSYIILPPVFLFRFPFAPYILTLSSRTLPPFAQILPAPSTLRYTLCPHSATFWQPASAYFPVPVSFLFEFPFSFHELHHALLPVP